MFPGLLDTLELGNVEKLVHSHQPQIKVPTVQRLQMLAPSASRADRSTIRDLMQSGKLVGAVRHSGRRVRNEERILQIQALILSVKSFHENMKYLQIANYIIRCHLITTLRKGEVILQALEVLWSPPDDCLVEHAEGQFSRVPRPRTRISSFVMVVIAVLRRFPHLCDGDYMGPRCKPGERHTPALETR